MEWGRRGSCNNSLSRDEQSMHRNNWCLMPETMYQTCSFAQDKWMIGFAMPNFSVEENSKQRKTAFVWSLFLEWARIKYVHL